MPSVLHDIHSLTALVSRLKNIDYSAVTHDQAVIYITEQCAGLTPEQARVVVQNVLG